MRLTLCAFIFLLLLQPAYPASVQLYYDLSIPQAEFAAAEIESAWGSAVKITPLDGFAESGNAQIVLCDLAAGSVLKKLRRLGAKAPGDLQPEGYSLRRVNDVLSVIGADAAGLMYGGLELAEQIRIAGWDAVRDVDHNPYMSLRGVKFNIPLDMRTPSYSDVSDAAQHNIAEMWSMDFWQEFIDTLARYRYNVISCWNLHPFPSLVRVPDYPEIALDDVRRSTTLWQEHYDLEGTGFDAPEIVSRFEVLKKMTIDEKIDFWRRVMAYGKSRNVDFYFITWNIFVNGTDGKYGITDDVENPVTRDYFRKSVRQMLLTYPELRGIGLTTGENMYGASFQQKEDWAFDAYAQGVLDAAAQQPGRRITLIHRQHMAGAADIAETFVPVIAHPDVEFLFSFKLAQAHVLSSTTQTFHQAFVKDIQSHGDLKTVWTLRNDDNYFFRWGAPDFVREFMQNIPHEVSRGYYYGSDQYVWGREFLMKEPESPRQLEIVKHWYQWMLWGRLGYDPSVTNERLRQILQAKFAGADAGKLLTAWLEASMIYPKTTGFHWGALDFQWYIEACQSRPGPAETPSGFHDVNRFITLPPHPGTGFVAIPEYVDKFLAGEKIAGASPLQVADEIQAHADRALTLLEGLQHRGDSELRHTLDDVRTMAYLGSYYSRKIRAATALALFRATLDRHHQQTALENLQQAATFWRSYAALALSNYNNPLWTNRVGYVDWRKNFQHVLYDLVIAGGERRMPSMNPTPGGILLEAEAALDPSTLMLSEIAGYTGAGYVALGRDFGKAPLTYSVEVPTAGRYIFEIRYINRWERESSLTIAVNGQDAGAVTLWSSGTPRTWVWDRALVDLAAGENTISIAVGGSYLIDHINLLPTKEH